MRYNFVGVHTADIPADYDPVPGMKYAYAVQVLYNPILAIVKTSMLMFLLRLSGQKRRVKVMIWSLLVLNNLLMIIVFFIVIFQCVPIAALWDSAITDARCIHAPEFFVASTAITLLTDILVLLLPFYIVMGLKMPLKTKIAVIGVFFLGFLVTVVGVVRMIFIIRGFFLHVVSNDPNYNIGFTTSALETNLAIITASAPAMKPLLKRWFPSLFNSTSHDAYQSGYGPSGVQRRSMGTGLKSGHGGYGLKDMKGRSEITSNARHGSTEQIMTMDGIKMTTDVSVRYVEDDHHRSRDEEEFGATSSISSI